MPKAGCAVPVCDGASSILTRQAEDALWQEFFTAAPERRRVFEPSSKRRKKVAIRPGRVDQSVPETDKLYSAISEVTCRPMRS
jgi:hypothetical protein